MRVVCISDLHGHLPTNLPEGDLLVIAGDICPLRDHSPNFQKVWLQTNFTNWLRDTQKKIPKIVYIAGNHDFIFQQLDQPKWYGWKSSMNGIFAYSNFYYLQDSGVVLDEIKIWGTPWQRRFYDWAFNLDEPQLEEKWKLIPNDTDIIICHGPAYGFGDAVPARLGSYDEEQWPTTERVGSPGMLRRIDAINPKLYVCGHIHSGYGKWQYKDTWIVNASLVNEKYKLVNEPIVIEL